MQESDGTSVRSAVMAEARAIAGEIPTPQLQSIVCPYCGVVTPDSGRCSACNGRFDPLSRQATQNQMGPWSIRDDRLPHRPGCSYETIARLIEQGKISLETTLRGPTTRQFWTLARHTPGISHLLGVCHSCQTQVKSDAFACPICHASFQAERDRQHLGLGPYRPLPGQGVPEVLAMRAEPASVGSNGPVAPQFRAELSHVGGSLNDQTNSAELAGARAQVQESIKLARRWKLAWQIQRRNSWIVLIIATILILLALAYGVMQGMSSNRNTDSRVSKGNQIQIHTRSEMESGTLFFVCSCSFTQIYAIETASF